MKRTCLIFPVLQLICLFCFGQPLAPDILSKEWRAQWITAPGSSGTGYEVLHFRKEVNIDRAPASFVIHVSADNRYKLFVNNVLVSLGPARADIFHWNFETVDIASYLHPGRNLLAAVVWNFGSYRQEAQQSYLTAFIVQGNTEAEMAVNTSESWKCIKDSAYEPYPEYLPHAYYAAGPGEKINFNFYPSSWQARDYNDSGWQPAKALMNGLPKGVFSYNAGWMLVPRTIPQVQMSPQRLRRVRSVSNAVVPASFPAAPGHVTIEPHQHATLLLDQGFETNAYPVLTFSKGKDAHIKIGYAESLFEKDGQKTSYKKGNRNEVDGKGFVGIYDDITASGNDDQQFSTLSWRTFRYVLLDITTAGEALTLNDIYGINTGYPFQFNATFESNDSMLNRILEVGWRTAKNCAVETYMDCPYYEQLQYVGDTRIQALVSLFNSGDDRLMRNAITQLDYSRMAEGITQSRYPTNTPQEIPPFSLWWIGMVHDYWMYRDDPDFVRQFLPGVRQVLHFFSRYQQPDGSLAHAPYWEFTDWSEGHGWGNGIPPAGKDGSSSELDFQLLWAYQLAAELEDSLGLKQQAAIYKEQAVRLMKTVVTKYWDPLQKLFADTRDKNSFSQHSNTLAILTGTVRGAASTELMRRILTDPGLTEATVYFKYYVNRALVKAGLGDQYLDQLGIWKKNLEYGLTTWAEMSDVSGSRSDCHAWGSSPNIELFRTVLGIDSRAPGFRNILIEPHPGSLTRVSGTVPHPLGNIALRYELKDGTWRMMVTLPPGTTGMLHFQNKSIVLKQGTTHVSIPADASKKL